MAVEKAAGEPIVEAERRVMSKTGRGPTFPRDIRDFSLSGIFNKHVEG